MAVVGAHLSWLRPVSPLLPDPFRRLSVRVLSLVWAVPRGRGDGVIEPLVRSELIAIEIALDELEAYVDVIGAEDDAHEKQRWAIRKLRALLAREHRRLEPFAGAAS